MKPMKTGTFFSLASAAMASNSLTEGAPGFSNKICVAPAASAWRKKPGLSTVRPAIKATLGPGPAVDHVSSEMASLNRVSVHAWTTPASNSAPASLSLPGPRNQGSTTSDSRADAHAPSTNCRPWNQPMPRAGLRGRRSCFVVVVFLDSKSLQRAAAAARDRERVEG